MSLKLKIRKYEKEDREEKKQVHLRAIREIASEDYTDEQIEAWSDFSDYGGIEDSVERWVAVEDGELIGLSDYRIDAGEVTGVYVDPDHLRKGVGSKLLEKVIQDAEQRGFDKLNCEASVTAKNFYKKNGFKVVGEVVHETNGVEMKAFEMSKKL